jgi:bacillithiol biosynthesis deacetylase BshB1
MNLDLMIFGAHPDDAEIGMGGTIAKQAAAGYKIGICDLTHAELSSNGDVMTRQQEAARAAQELGLVMRSCLQFPDRGLNPHHPQQVEQIAREIRAYRPQIVFIPYWQDRHPDHVTCSELMEQAIFNAKLRRLYSDSPAWNVEQIYYYFINDLYEANLAIDISDVYDRKEAALRAYRSQFTCDQADTVRTLLNQGYLERVAKRDALLGASLGVRYAESFVTKKPKLLSTF